MRTPEHADLKNLLAGSPTNWARWGEADEVGCLNYLDQNAVLRGIRTVRQGKVFTLQATMCDPDGDPMWPARRQPQRANVQDKSTYREGASQPFQGGLEYADDTIFMHLQGTTHYDGLGHAWYDDTTWNGHHADTTIGSMTRGGVLPIAERGVAGRGVLLDMARHRGKPWLDADETFDHEDLVACAQQQGVALEPGDILLIRTGSMRRYRHDPKAYADKLNEPGLTYRPGIVEWFDTMQVPNLITDTIANEVLDDPAVPAKLPLHAALMRNLGVVFTELAWLEDLAHDCDLDRQYSFCYIAAPLKVVGATGAPANPVAIK
ncbi:cyclase family protein [Nocardia sp. NRRL S-836]|uniref:cyclase family protein n=1 Tax=Nocardia sp. NRRL S-836 TaxID=1519492 RepID=UPI0006AE9A76|nr:cyclase family protein [Nocardia sp. NRRL S-836]KOV84601.1 metal-dependent hydrolase [Nocardia sp. NRRL S-836]